MKTKATKPEQERETDGEVRTFERHLPHPPEEVWQALTDESELAEWFPAANDCEREITESDPPHLLSYTMGDEAVRWEISPAPGGSRLLLTVESLAHDREDVTCMLRAA